MSKILWKQTNRACSVWGAVNGLKNQQKWSKLDLNQLILKSRQNIAFQTNAVSHLHHEMKAVKIRLIFIRLKEIKELFFINRLWFLTGQSTLKNSNEFVFKKRLTQIAAYLYVVLNRVFFFTNGTIRYPMRIMRICFPCCIL